MSDFIATAQATHPDIAGEYAKLEDLNSKKLWAQLTDALLSFVRDPKNSRGDNFLQLYDRFVAPVETKLNQVRVVQFVALAARQYYPSMPYIPAGELTSSFDWCPPVTGKQRPTSPLPRPSFVHRSFASLFSSFFLPQKSTAPWTFSTASCRAAQPKQAAKSD